MAAPQPSWLICPREGCPVERTRKLILEWARERENSGVTPTTAAYEHILTCTTCHQARGWQRKANGLEYALPDLLAKAAIS